MAQILVVDIAVRVLEKLASVCLQELGLAWGIKSKLRKLKDTLSTIKAVLLDAEEQQTTKHEVRDWLEKLKDVVYDIDDVLDDFSTEAERRKMEINGKLLKEVGDFFSRSNQVAFCLKMSHKMKTIRERLDEIVTNSRNFSFTIRGLDIQVRKRVRDQTHSFVRVADVIGRDSDKERIVKLLVGSTSRDNVSVIPIVGLGGLGKTTLAKLVYNDDRVFRLFKLRMWVCVSEDFNIKRLVEKIIKSATGIDCGHWEMDQLQNRLRDELSDKKFLLVLDDVWNDDRQKWIELINLLIGGAYGSKIIVTTRSNTIAEYMSTSTPYNLRRLSDDDCLCLFLKCAFKTEKELKRYPKLLKIGKAIVRKCGGNPLAVITLGSHLYMKTEEREWLHIRDSDIWKLKQKENDILPVLRLSYDQMPSYLKQCFAYCAVFPKDYEIWRVDLINLWIAQGLINYPTDGNLEIEDIGNQYFNELLSKSFFQDIDAGFDSEILTFKMHDLVHDLAQSVAGTECSVVNSNMGTISERVRHVLFCEYDLFGKEFPKSLCKIKKVRSFMFAFQVGHINKSYLDKLISKFGYLRILDLSQSEFKELPNSIGELKNLRYLNLSWNSSIKALPNSLCKLVNFQTLVLLDCEQLRDLPIDIGKVKSLRHLYLTSQLQCLPGEGTKCFLSLRSLWMVRCHSLTHLTMGTQYFSCLRTLRIVECSQLASLPSSMEHLTCLEKLWIWDCPKLNLMDGESMQGLRNLRSLYIGKLPTLMSLPQGLQDAATSLQYIRIASCDSLTALPEWLQAFTLLLELHIEDCRNLLSLPEAMPRLTALQVLNIKNCPHLFERYERETGRDWAYISHIPEIYLESSEDFDD